MKSNTRIDRQVPWDPNFDSTLPLFAPLRPLLAPLRSYCQWPGLDALQALLDRLPCPPLTHHGVPLRVTPQAGRPDHFEQHYAPRVYLHGELQTRTGNWHDLFQLLSWVLFPSTKAVINALHIPLAKARLASGEVGRRSPLENMLSLFDEGGVVLLASDPNLLELVRRFEWKALFWGHRDELAEAFHCLTFGHAIYEKGLSPYLGMTANAILIDVGPDYFSLPLGEQIQWVDQQLAGLLASEGRYRQPQDLQPFPLLGLPGWDPANRCEQYYDNSDYFRPGRTQSRRDHGHPVSRAH